MSYFRKTKLASDMDIPEASLIAKIIMYCLGP